MPDGRRKLLPAGYRIPGSDQKLLAECRVDVFRSGGSGGQHQNRTESGVRLVHEPTGIVTSERGSPSQHRNKARALARLRRKLEDRLKPVKKRIPTKPSRRAKQRRLEGKKRRSDKKKLRKKPRVE